MILTLATINIELGIIYLKYLLEAFSVPLAKSPTTWNWFNRFNRISQVVSTTPAKVKPNHKSFSDCSQQQQQRAINLDKTSSCLPIPLSSAFIPQPL
jgi:hypothetical protein